jgi:DnaK suppressor protein
MIVRSVYLRIIMQEATMTQSEVIRFREVLEATVIALDLSARRRDAIEIEKSADELESVFQTGERELALRNLEAESIKLRQTRAALRRIQEGTFGFCLECEEEISPKRLAALPAAALCVICQELVDCRHSAKSIQSSRAMAA